MRWVLFQGLKQSLEYDTGPSQQHHTAAPLCSCRGFGTHRPFRLAVQMLLRLPGPPLPPAFPPPRKYLLAFHGWCSVSLLAKSSVGQGCLSISTAASVSSFPLGADLLFCGLFGRFCVLVLFFYAPSYYHRTMHEVGACSVNVQTEMRKPQLGRCLPRFHLEVVGGGGHRQPHGRES
jgi:hypothetical protein